MSQRMLHYGDYIAVIDTAHGANCISLRNTRYNARILREPVAPYGEWDNPYLYGMPLLFPVNRISGGCFFFEGREYRFPVNEPATGCHLHGTLHAAPFRELEHDERHTVCAFRAKAGEYLGFPHDFEVRLIYELSDGGLSVTAEVYNRSSLNMPVFLGFHTTFQTQFCAESRPDAVRARVAVAKEYERDMTTYLPTGKMPPPDEVTRALDAGRFVPIRTPISRHYRAADGVMRLSDEDLGLSVVYESGENLPFRLIYCGGEAGSICLEPQTCLANCQNSPFSREENGFSHIAPSECAVYRTKIYIEEN